LQHKYTVIGEILPVAPIDKEVWTHSTPFRFRRLFYACCTNKLGQDNGS